MSSQYGAAHLPPQGIRAFATAQNSQPVPTVPRELWAVGAPGVQSWVRRGVPSAGRGTWSEREEQGEDSLECRVYKLRALYWASSPVSLGKWQVPDPFCTPL